MKQTTRTLMGALLALATVAAAPSGLAAQPKPLRVLLITGGCCHDYAVQKDLLKAGLEARAHVVVDQLHSADSSTKPPLAFFGNPDYAKGYDVVIHDECAAAVSDPGVIKGVLAPHRAGIPGVNLHCAMHSYRIGDQKIPTEAGSERAMWFDYLGIQSSAHGPKLPIPVTTLDAKHPIIAGLGWSEWTTGNEELYNNVLVRPTARGLQHGTQDVKQKDGSTSKAEAVVTWVNDFNGTRVFSTTLGHYNETVADARYLDLVTRGLLWACGKLNDEYLKPGTHPSLPVPAAAPSAAPAPAPKKDKKKKKTAAAPATTPVAAADDALPTPEQVSKMNPVTESKVAEILKEVKVPAGFEATVFATPPAVNYPVFVSAAPDGTLYVSSDGNGSLDRALHRGRILRVRDANADGRADEVKVFVADVDSPRGLVWDHDRLYVLHPPHISAFIDKDGDGVADEQKILVKNIAFTFKDRPADHTSNGLELGVDGWLYAAIGDFGFMQAEATDGSKLQLRGGGVVRVRPDGSNLHLFARGTRNILAAPVSPLLDVFARDNTNDGGGWDVRLHHLSGLDDHGYPRLFKNFADEIVQPLADYGGGSGCGAAWIDEPGIPAEWNNAPLTADWGRGWIFRHGVTRNGATFKADQKEFIGFPRPTDLDVDASGAIYAASWKGAQFKWAGNDVGYLVRVTAKGATPAALPNFSGAADAELVKLLEHSSSRIRLEAQRTILRRAGNRHGGPTAFRPSLEKLAADPAKPLASRVASLFALKLGAGGSANRILAKLASDATIAPWVLRALTDPGSGLEGATPAPVLAALKSPDAVLRKEAVIAATRLGEENAAHRAELAPALVPLLIDPDAVVAHTAMQALRRLEAAAECFAVIDTLGATPAERAAVIRVLFALHNPNVVDGLTARLEKESDPARRQGLLLALCRLHFIEGEWTGTSWGTRPDTRGPFYQPEPWGETQKIAGVLDATMAKADAREAAFLAGEFNRHRIEAAGALEKLLTLVAQDGSVLPVAVGQLARVSTVPADAVPLLAKAASAGDSGAQVRADAIQALCRAELNDAAIPPLLEGVALMQSVKGENFLIAQANSAFMDSRAVEKHHAALEREAAKTAGATSLWADAALLRIHDRAKEKQKYRAEIEAAFDAGWEKPARRAQLIAASELSGKKLLKDRILAALNDPNPKVAAAAKKTTAKLKLDAMAGGPLIGTMDVGSVLAAVMKTHGNVGDGEVVFTQVGCTACHTVRADEPLKGPFLGNISTIYKRRELAEAVLLPNKSLAQGFVAHRFVMKDELEYEGFVTMEAADKVVIRNVLAQEVSLPVAEIAQRTKLEKSLMPDGLVSGITLTDFASLLDYLEALSKN